MNKHDKLVEEVYFKPFLRSEATMRKMWDTTEEAGAGSQGRAGRAVHSYVDVHVKPKLGRVSRHTLNSNEWRNEITDA